jgi:hypothetical protein
MKLAYPKHYIVVIGKPLVSLEGLGLDCQCQTLYTEERFFPRILVDLEVFPSVSEIRKNRKELVKTFDKLDFITFKIGTRVVDVVVGE